MAFLGYETFTDWFLTDRTTGERTFVQAPNRQLLAFYVAFPVGIVLWLLIRPLGVLALLVATAALLWWAALEITSGVNPWRRTAGWLGLGSAVALASAVWHLRSS